MLAELNALVPQGRREKVDRQLARSIIGCKHRMGLGIHWSNQLANEHKPVRRGRFYIFRRSWRTPAPPRTFTNTVRPARSPPSSTRRDAHLLPIATDRLGRIQVIRRTEYGMTERDIIHTMTKQTGIPGHRLFEYVLHDPRDRPHFYLTYAIMAV